MRDERGRAGAAAARFGDADPAFPHREIDGIDGAPGRRDELDVDAAARVFELRAEASKIDRPRVVDEHDPMRVADVGGRALADVGARWRRRARRARSVTRPMPTLASTVCSSSVAWTATTRNPASVAMRSSHSRTPRRDRLGLREAPNAVAADLGARAVGVVERHAQVVLRVGAAQTDDQPIGADAAGAMTDAAREIGVVGPRVVVGCDERNEEVVAEAVMLRQLHGLHSSSTASQGLHRI